MRVLAPADEMSAVELSDESMIDYRLAHTHARAILSLSSTDSSDIFSLFSFLF